jgi:predicted ATPase/class 3 adenylate cyclase
VSSIAEWLASLGMAQYTQRFAEDDIDFDVLGELTDQDFDRLGVSVGHRRRMLKAIREHGGSAPVTQQIATAAPAAPRSSAERRQLTVMFCDLVGSTELSGKLDPEDMRAVIGAYHRCCTDLIERNGGFVAKYMGDGVLAYFGYPQAHEHDAERAVRAALALVEAVPKLKTAFAGTSLQVRVGIGTGLVVVGDLIGSGEAQERGIVGETPNLAARLQAIAEPNTVVIAENTRRLLGNLFELQDLGPKDIKGIAGAMRAWAALRTSSVESRFDALHATGLTPLVGREEESELLLRRWARAMTGEGQVVLISGEAGIGKSRLTAALLERLAADPHTRLRYFSSPQHTDSALYPITGQMERAAGLAHDDAPQAKLDKLDGVLARTSSSIEDAALLAEMLSIANDGRYPTLELTPQQRRQRTLDALLRQVEALTRQGPVLMILEDAHWADPTSLEVFGRLVHRVAPLRLLMVVTFRPEFEPPWIGEAHVTSMTINRLARRQVSDMIDRVVGNKLVLEDVRQDIIERSDGIPLFVEEMTKAVLEAESEGEARRTVAAVSSPALAVPASLHASLMARLDRLGPAKDVVQIGAAIGRDFSHALLVSVAHKPEAELAWALSRLVEAGLLFQQGAPPHASYLFKHALVQDAAYGTLLREPRRALHARIAEALEREFVEIAESQPELLARHCTEAGLVEKAAGLWGKAGQRSLARSALVEATAQLNRALDQIATLPETPAVRREQIKLQVALANALMHTKGYASLETKACLDRARSLIERAEVLGEPQEDPLFVFLVLHGFHAANFIAFNGDAIRELATQFMSLAEKQRATVPRVVGHRLMGNSLLFTGAIVEGRAHYDQAIALYNPHEHRTPTMRFGQTDMGVTSLCFRSLALWLLGYPEAALADTQHAIRLTRQIGQAVTLMYALNLVSRIYIECGNYSAARRLTDELIALATEKDSLFWNAYGTTIHGVLLAMTGEVSNAVPTLTTGMMSLRTTGATVFTPSYLSFLARAYADVGQFNEAWRCIGEAMTKVETTKEKWCEAEVHRTAGEITLLSPEPDAAKAESYFERALAVARAQQAKSWELRAAMSMARLWRDQGKRQQAHDLLAPVYGWFTEGFDTLDLKEAKPLLDELR